MDTVVARRLRPHEGRKLHALKRQLSNAVNSRHARIILLSRGGVRNRVIIDRIGCSGSWVREVIHRFNRGGIDAITWYPAAIVRQAPKFSRETVEQVAEVALSPPQQLIGMTVWSLSKLRTYLTEQRIVPSISVEWLRQLLRRWSVRWRHTKTWKESNDPEFWPKYKRIRALYARCPHNGTRLCVDEFGPLNLQPRHGRHYARTGHVDRLRATYHRTQGVRYLFGVYDLERDHLTGRFTSKKNARTFLSFLRWIRRRYPARRTLHIVLDNVSYHLTPDVIEFAGTHRMRFYLTPKYASWLNRIECHFTSIRRFCLDNTDYSSHKDQETAIRSYLNWRNGRRRITVIGSAQLPEWKRH
jgi:transposase